MYAIYAPDNLAKIELGFKEEIARFIKDGITKEELDIAVKGWVQSEGLSRAKDNELARTINNNLYYGRDMLFHKAIETQIKTLTVRSVNKAIKTYFKPFNAWTVVNAGDFDN